ncbi:DUF4383 domain-containing protein [Deinococcus sonorensis]|uniref:DUF4383 domain-containing protein n=2 Tax=Deinococcus sonorensis TaxID=309891 RepID=A0AAU7UDC4_9DEIO
MTVRNFARWIGIVFILVGILGFIPGITQMMTDSSDLRVDTSNGMLLGLFHVNLIHNLVHILLGLWGVASAGRTDSAVAYARGITYIYAILAVLGLIPATNTLFGLAPIGGADVGLHIVLAAIAAYFGWGVRDSSTARA